MLSREAKIHHLLARNVTEVIERKHLEDALRGRKPLRVKLGIDPTTPDLHLGHAVVLEKLKEFQDLGHKIVLIIGDFTAQIGDPSGKSKTRPPLTEKEVKANMKNYLAQAGMILDTRKAEIHYNSQWFKKKGAAELIALTASSSLQQVLARADFKKRIEAGNDVTLLELLYPVFQGYDSVEVKADVEIGGTDQTFNLLSGRKVQRYFKVKEQDVMTLELLVGLDGVKKMSKSLGNYVALNDKADEMYGKIMSVPDGFVEKYFLLCTEFEEKQIESFLALHPRERKAKLAFAIVERYHGKSEAKRAEEKFNQVFSKKELTGEFPTLRLKTKKTSAIEIVMASGVVKSKSEARRLILQGGFSVEGKVKKNPAETLALRGGEVLKIGKHRFFRVQ